MGKSSSASEGRVPSSATNPLLDLARIPIGVRRAHAAVHRFVEHLEAEVGDAVHAAGARQLAAIRRVEQIGRYLYSQHPSVDQAESTPSKKSRGMAIAPDVILASRPWILHRWPTACVLFMTSILALEPYEGVPFKRKPVTFRNQGGQAKATVPGPEDTGLPPWKSLVRTWSAFFAAWKSVWPQVLQLGRQKKPKAELPGMLTPPKVAECLGVSPDKVRNWIAKGELNATNVAVGKGGRPRYRISETDLADFQKKRQPSKPSAPALRRRKKDPNVIEFF